MIFKYITGFCFVIMPYFLFAQCTGFPTTVAEEDCALFNPISSNTSIQSGTTLGACSSGPAVETYSNLNLNGGILRICGNVTISGSLNSGTIVVQCGATMSFSGNFTLNQNIKVINYGNIIVSGSLIFQNTNNVFYNEGLESRLIVSGNINFPQNSGSNAFFKNNGYVEIGGTFNALNGGYTCLGEESVLKCNHFKYGQNCGAPSYNMLYGGANGGTSILQYNSSADLRATVTADPEIEVQAVSGATINFNGCGSWGSATQVANATIVTDPGPANFLCLPNCFSVLPIELLSFELTCKDDLTELLWETASEINNNFYTIEHSNNGIEWYEIGVVNGAGNSTQLTSYKYSFKEESGNASNYYRLKQTDFDGRHTYSKTIYGNCQKKTLEWEIHPNPVDINDGSVTITNACVGSRLDIYDQLGKKCFSKVLLSAEVVINPQDLGAGMFFYQFSCDTKNKTFKVIHQ